MKMNNRKYMPVCLDLQGKLCLVVGGGNVASRKISVLIKFGACVTCVSPKFIQPLKRLGALKKIQCIRMPYSKAIALNKYALVIAATDDPQVNRIVADRAGHTKALVNVVDKSACGNMIMPAILNYKGIVLGVSTNGHRPGLAKKIRDIIKNAL